MSHLQKWLRKDLVKVVIGVEERFEMFMFLEIQSILKQYQASEQLPTIKQTVAGNQLNLWPLGGVSHLQKWLRKDLVKVVIGVEERFEMFMFLEIQSILKQYQASEQLPTIKQTVAGTGFVPGRVLSDLHTKSFYPHNQYEVGSIINPFYR